MQPNSNRPVFIVQPSNITHLNVRPTIITTGGQPIQPQFPQQQQQQQQQTQSQLVYQIPTVRQPTMPQQASTLYQVQQQQQQAQPRLVTSTPVYNSSHPQRFVTSPPQIITPNANMSPRLNTLQTTQRPLMTPTQATTVLLGPAAPKVSTPPTIVAAATPVPAPSPATTSPHPPGTKEFIVRVPKPQAQYGVMEFASGVSIDVKEWKSIQMQREINSYTYRPPTNLDQSNASSTTITTSLGVTLPKTGAGSEYGREQKEALKRKRYATKGTNMEDLPWVLTDRSSADKKWRHYRGMKKGGVTTNSSYYVFIQGKDGFEAFPVEDWYGFTPTNVYKTLDFDEAEKQFQERHKHHSKWYLMHKVKSENDPGDDGDNDDEKGKKKTGKGKRDFKLLDAEEWANDNEEEEDDDDDDGDVDGDNDKSNKKSKTGKKNSKKPKTAWTLSDEEEEDELAQKKAKKAKKAKSEKSDGQKEDSDDGDQEGYEVEYTSDELSSDEDGKDGAAEKYEIKGVDEEMKVVPDIEKKLEQMDENNGEIDFFDDDEEEEVPDMDDMEDEAGKGSGGDLNDFGKLFANDAIKEIESSSDDDDMDDSDDPDKESNEPVASSVNSQPIPSEQVKTEKGHKKAREEEMRAIKSKVMSLPTTPSNPTDAITEEKVRSLLQRKPMTIGELIQMFLPKLESQRTKELKDSIVQKLATVIKRLDLEEKIINKKKHIKLKST
ncbi:unnamed protein product [Adineta ricciae]|nr:unnamed protein product [Adineta ricciae]